MESNSSTLIDTTPVALSVSATRALPAVVDQYRLLRPLGWGGSGIVYEAEDTRKGGHVALKLIPHQSSPHAARPQPLGEAHLAGQVRHRHLVALYHAGAYPGGVYLAMELVRGWPLQAGLDDGPLPWREATAVVIEACEGLAALHARGVVHGDVKPANLLRACDGTVKLTDFGLVRRLDRPARPAAGTGPAGTLHYMSPEQCREEAYDERSDLYALGATYYALLTGRTPYSQTTPRDLMVDHCSAPVPDPRDLCPEVPAACARIVRRSMAKHRADRYGSALAMGRALRGALARDAWRRRWRRVPLAILGLAALAAAPGAGARLIGGGFLLAGLLGRPRVWRI